jgi:hypothetical protein
LVTVRVDLKVSGESPDTGVKLVTVVAPGKEEGAIEGGDRRIANTRDGRPV